MAVMTVIGIPENTCIICRQEKSKGEFSDEHVIPDSLNGYYHIDNVCKDCNSNMGRLIDNHLINHKLTDLYRCNRGIAGKTGKIPNPFSGIFKHADSDGKFIYSEKDDGTASFKMLPSKPIIKDIDDSKVEISITFDENVSEVERYKEINKILERNNLIKDNIKITKSEKVLNKEVPFIQQWNIEVINFKMGLLKIAYEFAVNNIPNYYHDPFAIEFSEILRTGDTSKLEKIMMGSGLDFELFNKLEVFFDYDDKHLLWLMPIDEKLLCFIKLDTLFAIPLALSSKPYINFQNSIIGINDLKKRCFSLHSLTEILVKNESPTYTRFFYFFRDTKEIEDYKKEINGNGRQYIGENQGNPILFSSDGKIICTEFFKFLDTCKLEVRIDNNSLISFFDFGTTKEFFIKGSVTRKLYQVVGFETDRKIHKV